MAKEAYVKITEVLKDAPALASTATPFLVAGAIKSAYGNYDVNYFTSRKKFLETYTCDGKLTGRCDVSLINAYEVLGSAPILVVRAKAKDYVPAELISKDSEQNKLFSIMFRDFMKDSNFQVVYSMKKSVTNPGAVELNLKYERIIDLYRYTSTGIVDGGEGYKIGDIVTLTDANNRVSLKAKVLAVGTSGSKEGVVTSLKLITDIGPGLEGGASSGTFTAEFTDQFKGASSPNLTSTDGTGLEISVSAEKLPNEQVKEYNVVFALDDRVADAQGNSLYYKNVWDDEWPFEISLGTAQPTEVTVANPYVEVDPTQPETLTYLDYGPAEELAGTLDSTIVGESSDVYDPVADPSGKHWAKFETFESRHIPMFSDFGTANVGTYLKPLANQFNAQYVLSLPRNMESVAGAETWNDLDLGNSRFYGCTPFAVTTNLGFMALIAPTSQYIATICTNAVAGREFEAVAGKETGVVGYANLTKSFDKEERERLLDLKINTITYREVDGYAMFNDDLTGLVQNNPFKEEFNRRLGVRIAQDVDTLMQQFKFKLNTAALRDTIQGVIANYFDTASFKKKIWAYEVICNDDNNPPSLQAQNKLAVTVNIAFYYTAKYIEVVNNIYSVGQSFSE
jgi:hypothetical protein